MNVYERLNSVLVAEFDRYVMEHPGFAAKIPENAQVVLQMEGNSEYNKWIREVAETQRDHEQPVVCVRIKRLRLARSRLVRPSLQKIFAE